VLAGLILWQGAMLSTRFNAQSFLQAIKEPPQLPPPQAWRSTLIPHWISSVTALIFTNLDVVLVGMLIGEEDAGYYFAANRLALAPSLFMVSYNIVAGPLFSGHFEAGRLDELKTLTRRASVNVFILSLGVILVLAVFAEPALCLFGAEFSEAATILRWLLLACLLNTIFGPNDLILNMCGQERLAMWSALWSMVIGCTAIAIGASLGNTTLVAQMVCLAVAFARLLNWWLVWRTMQYSPDVFTSLRMHINKKVGQRGCTDR
jgi:O-antigen/teichoic acid export membrane protein